MKGVDGQPEKKRSGSRLNPGPGDHAGARRVITVMELLLFMALVGAVVAFMTAGSTMLTAALVVVLLLFAAIMASRSEPSVLGAWLGRVWRLFLSLFGA